MFNPSRRNKHIGTSKQGHGQNNQLVIPERWHDLKRFWEKIEHYTLVEKYIREKKYIFIVEHTREHSYHACTIDDLVNLIWFIPEADLEELNFIVLRQPKRKESILSPVWGRLIYSFGMNSLIGPAIILESLDFQSIRKWSRKLSPDDQQEFERLKLDGHHITEDKRYYYFHPTLDPIRNTQLYRTFLHEIGHYVHYLESVTRPLKLLPEADDHWEKYWDTYHNIPNSEKEVYAHNYADQLKKQLTQTGAIPFERRVDLKEMEDIGLDSDDFILVKD